MGLRLIGMAMLTLMFALAKLLGAKGVNLVELVFYRQLFAVPVVCAWIMWTVGASGFATGNIGRHVPRTIAGLVGMALNFAAVTLLPLAEATTLGFTAPIFATVMSALILREATGIHRWSAVLVGFGGVIIMARPDTAHLPPLGLTIAILAALVVATVSIILRALSRTETPSAIVLWFSVLSIPPIGVLMFWFGQTHDPVTFALIIAMGVAGGIGQLFITGALRWGQIALVLPMDYSSIIWAALLGWVLWGVLPVSSTWAGAGLIIASGLYIVFREHRLGLLAKLKARADADLRA